MFVLGRICSRVVLLPPSPPPAAAVVAVAAPAGVCVSTAAAFSSLTHTPHNNNNNNNTPLLLSGCGGGCGCGGGGCAGYSTPPLLLHARDFHSRKFSRNVEFFTASDTPLPKNTLQVASTLGGGEGKDRPLALLFCWLMAKERHIRKYTQMYTNMGIDVLKVRISPFDLLLPTKGSQVAAEQVVNFLHANPSFGPLMVHGFSVGAYLFMEVMGKIGQDMDKHGHLLGRFAGQIWDSAVDMYGIPDGVPRAITNNVSLQRNIKKYLLWYLKAHYNSATVHYERASARMHDNFVGVPGLFFFSDNDPVSTPEMNAVVYKKWEAKNYPVYTRLWKDSAHVSHYMKHRKEYEEEVVAFMERIGILEPTRQRATLV